MPDVFEIPDRIARLKELAYDFWWSWDPEARHLFEMLDRVLWDRTHHNPVAILRDITPERLKEAVEDPSFLRHYDGVLKRFDHLHTTKDTWVNTTFPGLSDHPIAYFSAEFGLHNSLPIYSGGLGILAGDHCKEAGEIGLPLVGIGFLYPQGYFHQRIQADGWQEAIYRPLDLRRVAIEPVTFNATGENFIQIPVGNRMIYIAAWKVQVGRARLFLMDTNIPQNEPWDRELSARLYAGDEDLRIRQEIVLGIGGVRLLRALNIAPAVWHCNEGHTAFQMLERIRERVSEGESFERAAAIIRKTTVFTTHTPVPAGHDAFPSHLVEKYFSSYWPGLGLDQAKFWALGKHQEDWGEAFNMTVLALGLSKWKNAVSVQHGKVSRKMWHHLWPDLQEKDVPISSITNGIHTATWIAPELIALFRRYIAPDWADRHDEVALWQGVSDIPDKALWEIRQKMKRKLLNFIRERARMAWLRDRAEPVQLLAAGTLLNPEALTIGYARRFAGYKRANLIFHDLERLKKILGNLRRPVQIIFAGKAHPADDIGKHLLQQIYNFAKDSKMAGHIVFVENYEMHVAHFLVQGVDIWLNSPRPPLEASGTSGMKAALNGVPQLSIPDGWWPEAHNGSNGWAFGGASASSQDAADAADAKNLYEILENEVIPLYYRRDSDGIPRGWTALMKETIRTIVPQFSMRRAVKEYTTRFYAPAINGEKSGQKPREGQ